MKVAGGNLGSLKLTLFVVAVAASCIRTKLWRQKIALCARPSSAVVRCVHSVASELRAVRTKLMVWPCPRRCEDREDTPEPRAFLYATCFKRESWLLQRRIVAAPQIYSFIFSAARLAGTQRAAPPPWPPVAAAVVLVLYGLNRRLRPTQNTRTSRLAATSWLSV